MARDRYLDRQNPWFDLFRVDRGRFTAASGGLCRSISIIRTTCSATVSHPLTQTPSTMCPTGQEKSCACTGRKSRCIAMMQGT